MRRRTKIYQIQVLLSVFLSTISIMAFAQRGWQSGLVHFKKGKLQYVADEQGNVLPDFSRVGYHQNQVAIPDVPVVISLEASGVHDQERIQEAINQLSAQPLNAQGYRGAILLKKGIYKIPGTIRISSSGIVIRGEGDETKLIATGRGKRKTIQVSGAGKMQEVQGSRVDILDAYVPVGAKSFHMADATGFRVGDQVMIFRPGTEKWIYDLKMDQIEAGSGTIQWKAEDYNLNFERTITAIKGSEIFLDNPVVMAMETQYGGGSLYKYTFDGRIAEVGIEKLLLESEYQGDTDEEHGWDALSFNKIENGWVDGVTSKYFGYSCVNLGADSKQITVKNSKCLSPKSQIIGGRRYSFNNDGQLNLFMDCFATEGRHDYVTGAKVCGPNVFYNCRSEQAKADIGPHHRWAVGTLFDNIITDGEINVQDRGNWGTGHGWSGVNQILWNCTAKAAAVQNPYVSGKNYAIGLQTKQVGGRLKDRPEGVWEGQNKKGLNPSSLYLQQVKESKNE